MNNIFNPSKYQEAVINFTKAQSMRISGNLSGYKSLLNDIIDIDFIKNRNKKIVFENQRHAVVTAVAGSGKTRTAKELIKVIPRTQNVVFVAFNKHIADNLKTELPHNARAMTLHSMGFSSVLFAMRQNGKKPILNEYKVNDMLKVMFQTEYMEMSQEDISKISPVIIKIVSLLKGTLLPIERKSIEYLMERYSIDNDVNHDKLTEIVARIMLKCKEVMGKNITSEIDFNDQIWLPVVLNLPVYQNDFIIVDEAQDMNPCQLELALKACKSNGTVIAIGDPNQSIYGFTGADTESIPNIVKRLGAIQIPLSISYRCPISHVEIANEIVNDMEASPWAELGEIRKIKEDELYKYVKEDELIICRYNAPLVKPCFQLIRDGKKAIIKGKDIGKNLITLIRNIKGKSMKEFIVNLNIWMKKEKERCEVRGISIESVMDKYETINVLAENCDTPDCIIKKIEIIFSDDRASIIFSSIHKAKGLESNSVYILRPSLIPSTYAKAEWEFDQERNLKYVALTRSKKILTMVE